MQCFVSITSNGIRSGGGVGDVLSLQNFNPQEAMYRVAYDVSFWVLITIIGLNVVFTVIVGNFSKLREEQLEIQDNLEKQCIICDQMSPLFDLKESEGFEKHVKKQHNVLHYLYFFMMLRQKKQVTIILLLKDSLWKV